MSKKKTTPAKSTPTPLVSVIVAAYNVEKYLAHCLDTLLAQTLDNIEIIVIEDQSTDATKQILQSYAQKDPRIVPLYNEKNLGLSGARNRGIAIARAEYLTFCDSDDFYQPDTCEKLYSAMQKTGADVGACEDNIIYYAHREMKPSDDFYYSLKFMGLNAMSDEIIMNTDVSMHNKIYRKSLMDRYNLRCIEGLLYEDAYFTVAYFCVSKDICFVNEKLYNYVRRDNSIMSNTWSTDKSKDRAIDHLYEGFKLYDFLEKNHLLERYNEVFWQLFLRYEYFAIDNSKTAERRAEVRAKAREFIEQHQASFAQAEPGSRNEIMSLNARNQFFNTVRLKRLLLKFMPTYRLQISNVLRARTLKNRQHSLVNKVNKMLKP